MLTLAALILSASISLNPIPAGDVCTAELQPRDETLAQLDQDVDQDGKSDHIELYVSDRRVYIDLITDWEGDCSLLLERHVNDVRSIDERRITVHALDVFDVTGDGKPDIYLWVDTVGGGPHQSFATFAGYSSDSGSWREIYRLPTCVAFHHFEFRPGPGTAKNIYVENDQICEFPSTSRRYVIYEWDGAAYQVMELGEKRVVTLFHVLCLGCLLSPALILVAIYYLLFHPRLAKPASQAIAPSGS